VHCKMQYTIDKMAFDPGADKQLLLQLRVMFGRESQAMDITSTCWPQDSAAQVANIAGSQNLPTRSLIAFCCVRGLHSSESLKSAAFRASMFRFIA
jgi:hypothetical protein